jgi:glutathione S-transferase
MARGKISVRNGDGTMIKAWGRIDSSNVAKVLWTLSELGLPYERVDWGGRFGGNDKPDYRALNPHGKVPTLEDGGTVVWESNVIVRYLGARYGGDLWPADAANRAALEQWMDWTSLTLAPALGRLRKRLKSAPDEDATAALQECTVPLAILESWLSKRDYVGGGAFTLGDVPLGPVIHRWFQIPRATPSFPALDAYRCRLAERSAYRAHIATLT